MWRLVATAPGHVPMEYPLFPLTDETDLPPVELPRDAGLQVRIVAETGIPVAGARVLTAPSGPRDTSTPWKRSWEPAEQLAVTDMDGRALLPGSGDSLRIEVRLDGGFRFEGIFPGSYRLDAVKEGKGRTSQPVPVTVAEAPLDGIVLELASTGTINGRILGLNVDELAQVRVSAGWGSGLGAVAYDGSYRITDLTPGTWKVVADLPRTGRRAEGEVTLEPGADAELDLDFAAGLTLSGRLTKNGRPFAGATLTLHGPDAMPVWAETGPEGRFELQGLGSGVYRLEVSDYRAGLLQARRIDLQQNQDIVLDLLTATLAGVVLDASERQPLAQVELTLTSLGAGEGAGTDHRIVSSADGSFTCVEVAEGPWKLTAGRPGFHPKEHVLSPGDSWQRMEILLQPASGSVQAVSPP